MRQAESVDQAIDPRAPVRIGVVDMEHPDTDKRWDTDRDETEAQRLDRNWSSLLQELRVTQTGVQLLTGFLLTIPFQQRFTGLDGTMKIIYLVTVACSLSATVLLIAPVGMHRVLFRRHRLDAIVSASHACAVAGLIMLGLALAGVAAIIYDTVAGGAAGWIAAGCTLAAFVVFWFVIPLPLRRKADRSY